DGLLVEKLPKLRLHVRAILRDDRQLFIGSQSLRPVEPDRRPQAGVIRRDPKVIKQFRTVFEADWALTDIAAKQAKEADQAERDKSDKSDEQPSARTRQEEKKDEHEA